MVFIEFSSCLLLIELHFCSQVRLFVFQSVKRTHVATHLKILLYHYKQLLILTFELSIASLVLFVD